MPICIKDQIQNMNIVIGTETGKRTGKAISKPEWVWNLTEQAHRLSIPVFMKEDILPIMGEANMVQELPEAFRPCLNNAETLSYGIFFRQDCVDLS